MRSAGRTRSSAPPAGRSSPRLKAGTWVTFEADHYDEHTRSGWSVLVTGRAEVVYEESEIQRLSGLDLHPWVTAVKRPFWIRIRPTSVTGRQTPGA